MAFPPHVVKLPGIASISILDSLDSLRRVLPYCFTVLREGRQKFFVFSVFVVLCRFVFVVFCVHANTLIFDPERYEKKYWIVICVCSEFIFSPPFLVFEVERGRANFFVQEFVFVCLLDERRKG